MPQDERTRADVFPSPDVRTKKPSIVSHTMFKFRLVLSSFAVTWLPGLGRKCFGVFSWVATRPTGAQQSSEAPTVLLLQSELIIGQLIVCAAPARLVTSWKRLKVKPQPVHEQHQNSNHKNSKSESPVTCKTKNLSIKHFRRQNANDGFGRCDVFITLQRIFSGP